ncbi:hypothetical protein KTQ42_19610 [Noviherbaspirillum sp. L7-7A]|uniref:hypothetical protein n=1 Tax=Noviherbaspirillum sp. L7-7A TaxID=2850560 RepID=UPI001C2C0C84|nr:hypothetical protein [Noviherbaspirillum sp. L7-7A]MBV0881498.1 hypothetical protein [Noviherbaspirillum sp. L7-7A]
MFSSTFQQSCFAARLRLVFAVRIICNFYYWLLTVQTVSVINIDFHGFNEYEYTAVPSIKPNLYRVAFRHWINGKAVSNWSETMDAREWLSIRNRLTDQEAHSV